jgi:hypothetical protein
MQVAAHDIELLAVSHRVRGTERSCSSRYRSTGSSGTDHHKLAGFGAIGVGAHVVSWSLLIELEE